MKIKLDNSGQTRKNLSELAAGDCFYFDGRFYIKTNNCCMVNLDSGEITDFTQDYHVTVIEVSAVATFLR